MTERVPTPELPTRRRVDVTPSPTVAQAWLLLLRSRGVDCLFGNPGTEFFPIMEALERLGPRAPRPITVPHEFTAVAMAHGYYEMTDRAQAVMVHTTVGTANALGAPMDASHLHVPMLFCAGRTPISESGHAGGRDKFIHWAQETYDQGGMTRPWTKWDYELRDPSTLEAVVDRAFAVAMSGPRGPVHLMMPREILSKTLPSFSYEERPRQPAALEAAPDPAWMSRIAHWTGRAERPLIVANRLDARAAETLACLSQTFAIPVVTPQAHTFCLPRSHRLHLGEAADYAAYDCVIVLDVDVPWCPVDVGPWAKARVVQVAEDPLQARIPLRSHAADVVVTASPRLFLESLLTHLPSWTDPGRTQRRARDLAAQRAALDRELTARINRVKDASPIDPLWVSACVAAAWDDAIVLINELSLPAAPLPLARPRSYLRASPASCLGWGLGAALGARLAAPASIPLAVVGDGAYIFANPAVAHQVSRAYDVPFLTIVLNNGCYGSIETAARRKGAGDAPAFTSLQPSLDFARIVEAAGGVGERVDDPRKLAEAVKRGLRLVKDERRQVVLDVICQ